MSDAAPAFQEPAGVDRGIPSLRRLNMATTACHGTQQEYVPRPESRVENLRDIIPPPLSIAFFRLEQLL
jgi:hypothetical protein